MEILTLLCCIFLSSSREYNASSRSSKKNFWRRCRGGLGKIHIPSTYHKPLSFALHFLPLVFLSPTSPLPFYSLLFFCEFYRSLASCLLVCCIACSSQWLPLLVLILTLRGWRRLKTMLEVLCMCNLSIMISSESSLNNKKLYAIHE